MIIRNFIKPINRIKAKEVVSVIFGNPYVLESFGEQLHTNALIVAYQDTKYTRKSAGELIFG